MADALLQLQRDAAPFADRLAGVADVDVKEYTDLPPLLIQQIQHFFENYKDLEKGKWVKIEGWGDAEAARAEITKSVAAYKG